MGDSLAVELSTLTRAAKVRILVPQPQTLEVNVSTLIKTYSKNLAVAYITKVVFGTILIALSAQISIPFYPVPMTLQPLAVMLVGLLCTPSMAASIMVTYILEAAIGLPVLSNFTGGLPHLLGTRGGYIFGFLPLALSISFFRQVSEGLLHKILGSLLGNAILYLMGITWLSQFIGFEKALQAGLYPFLWEIPLYISFAIVLANLLKPYTKGKF